MKKLLLLLAMFISVASFANHSVVPEWDVPLKTGKMKLPFDVKQPFTDPYITNEFTTQIGDYWTSNYALQFQVAFNTSVPQAWYVTWQVAGTWASDPNAFYKEFTVILSSGQWQKTQKFALNSQDRPAWQAWSVVIDAGPY